MDADAIPINAFIRIQMEYLEMPGLKLTSDQIARLCGLSRDISEAALADLANRGFLRRAQDGSFLRPSTPASNRPSVVVRASI